MLKQSYGKFNRLNPLLSFPFFFSPQFPYRLRQEQAGGIAFKFNHDVHVWALLVNGRQMLKIWPSTAFLFPSFVCAYPSSLTCPLNIGFTPQAADFSNQYICVCLSVRASNGVKSDSNCQSSHTGFKIESKMVRQKAVCSSTHLYVCIWELESIWLSSISASPLSEPPPNNKNHYSHFAVHQWTFVIPLCR